MLNSDDKCMMALCFSVDAYNTVQTLTLFWKFKDLGMFNHIFAQYNVAKKRRLWNCILVAFGKMPHISFSLNSQCGSQHIKNFTSYHLHQHPLIRFVLHTSIAIVYYDFLVLHKSTRTHLNQLFFIKCCTFKNGNILKY